MPEVQSKPLQATFDVDEYDAEVVEGIGFEPGQKYTFTLEKGPQGKYMQYGAAKGGLYVLSKKAPKDLAESYEKHPDQYEIFQNGEINGQQALVPGKDFDKFRPFLTKTVSVAWVHNTDSGQKRLVFMQFNAGDQLAANDKHPEWESLPVRVSRKFGYNPPSPGSKEKFSFSWLHPGVTISAEVLMVKRKGQDREQPQIDIDSIDLLDGSGAPAKEQKTLADSGIDPEIKMTILEVAEGKKTVSEVIKALRVHLKENKMPADAGALGKYSEAITRMKDSKEILA